MLSELYVETRLLTKEARNAADLNKHLDAKK